MQLRSIHRPIVIRDVPAFFGPKLSESRHVRSAIQSDFEFEGKRYRPTLKQTPTGSNLKRAQKQLDRIRAQIAAGTFSFVEEFPDYKFQGELEEVRRAVAQKRVCNGVFDDFVSHRQMRVEMN